MKAGLKGLNRDVKCGFPKISQKPDTVGDVWWETAVQYVITFIQFIVFNIFQKLGLANFTSVFMTAVTDVIIHPVSKSKSHVPLFASGSKLCLHFLTLILVSPWRNGFCGAVDLFQ